MERRSSNRIAVKDETTLFTHEGYFTAILENISAGGIFLRTNRCIEIGETIEITIPLPDSPDNSSIVVRVVAVRITDNGVAFKFEDVDDNTRNALFHLTKSAYA